MRCAMRKLWGREPSDRWPAGFSKLIPFLKLTPFSKLTPSTPPAVCGERDEQEQQACDGAGAGAVRW